MTDSSEGTITYTRIQQRAKQDALEYMPEFPKLPNQTDFTNESDHEQCCMELWQDFYDTVDSIEACDVAHESCEWDWVIYYHRALELCQAVPTSVLHDAESELEEMYFDTFLGLYETAAGIAAQIVIKEIADAVEQIKEELLEVAVTAIDNMES